MSQRIWCDAGVVSLVLSVGIAAVRDAVGRLFEEGLSGRKVKLNFVKFMAESEIISIFAEIKCFLPAVAGGEGGM
ncbi:MAG: hypothetical protein LKE74_02530 [Prevotella sp.]|jgi:hypothetical protein|nr:hypothetical protein [Prevotella sp.]MCH4017318.1 hypothetical protein [Prevotella sp.]